MKASHLLSLLGLSVVLLGSWPTDSLQAQPPKITSFFPAGLQRGTSAEITLNGKPGKTPVTALSMQDSQLQLTVSEKADKLTVVTTDQTRPGLHWIRLINPEGSNKLLPLLVGVLPEAMEKEPNNNRKQAGDPLAMPVVMNGILHKNGEIDMFPVQLAAGETLIASLDAFRSLGSPMDAALQLVDENGFIVADNDDDHGFDPLISWTAPASGKYYVQIFAFPSAPNSTIGYAGGGDYVYRLTLTTGPFLAASGAPDKGLPHIGWGVESLPADAVWSTPGLHGLPPLELQTAWSTAAAISPELSALPTVLRGVVDQEPPSQKTAITLKKGESIRVRIAARSLDSLLDPVLEVWEGEKLHQAFDDIRNFELDVDAVWKAPADGTFTLVVVDRYGKSGPRYHYLMDVEMRQPWVVLTVAQESWIGKADQAIEIPITINRLYGFAETLKFRVEGLGDQQTVEVPASESKGDHTKAVTLKIINQAAEPVHGPIRIVAEWGTEGAQTLQPVTANLVLPAYTTDQLWLTIPPSAKKPEASENPATP